MADGENVRDIATGNDIHFVEIEPGRNIGEKRNFGCAMARGEFIAHWDDDDYSAPGRIADQVGRLKDSGLAVTAYDSMYFGDAAGAWWHYQGKMTGIGTSLVYRKDWWAGHKFPAKPVCEDSEFMYAALRDKQIITAPAGLLMAATIHERNTSKRTLGDSRYKRQPEFAGVPGMRWPCD